MIVGSNNFGLDVRLAVSHFRIQRGYQQIYTFTSPKAGVNEGEICAVFDTEDHKVTGSRTTGMGVPGGSRLIYYATTAELQALLATQRPNRPEGVLWGPHGEQLLQLIRGKTMPKVMCGCGVSHWEETIVDDIDFYPSSWLGNRLLQKIRPSLEMVGTDLILMEYDAAGTDSHGRFRHGSLSDLVPMDELRKVMDNAQESP